MKKLYNKALLYQYYHSGKWALILGSIIFAVANYFGSIDSINYLKFRISSLEGDRISRGSAFYIFVELFVLFMIYVLITGINKRNNLTFLTSGPYSKEEIKKNQIIFLLISLTILTLIYIYIYLCIYYREREVLMISVGWLPTLIKDIIRLIVCGLAFISYLVLMDTLFSNSGITIFLIIFTPIVFIVDLSMCFYLSDVFKGYSLFPGEVGVFISKMLHIVSDYVLNYKNVVMIGHVEEILAIILIIFATGIFFLLTWLINKKLIINNINKFFNFKIVEKIFYWTFSFSIMLLITVIIASMYAVVYLQDIYFGQVRTINGTIIALSLIVGIGVIAAIFQRLIRKLMKKFI
ncbi:hypothetical protein [Clostridium sp. HBUAS56017]|uniref:hypothetical protein n=1 Tax=Clostridium sp. HBUAS56017 TaxID=2571128 RepID=UPI001178A88D|nr:hypothetical protein [Clostridium sp. HBUAS56017]